MQDALMVLQAFVVEQLVFSKARPVVMKVGLGKDVRGGLMEIAG